MAEISIIEFIVYGIVGYSGLLVLILSVNKEMPAERASSLIRVIWLIPSIYCIGILMFMDAGITLDNVTTNNTIVNLNTTEVFQETTTESRDFTLSNPVWGTVHFMFAIVLIIYVIRQILILLTKT